MQVKGEEINGRNIKTMKSEKKKGNGTSVEGMQGNDYRKNPWK